MTDDKPNPLDNFSFNLVPNQPVGLTEVECTLCTHQWVEMYDPKKDKLKCPHCGKMNPVKVIE